MKNLRLFGFVLFLLCSSFHSQGQFRERKNELSIRWSKTLFIEQPLFHAANALPIGLHYTRHFANKHGFQVELGGEFQDLGANREFYMDNGRNEAFPWLRFFVDGSFKWLYPIVYKKQFRLHAIGGVTYRKMLEAYGGENSDLLIGIFSDYIGPQLGLKTSLRLGRFFSLGLSQEVGAFHLIEGTGFPPNQREGIFITSPINFTTRFSLGFCF